MTFRINQPIFDDGEWNDDLFSQYIVGLMSAFSASPEAEEFADQFDVAPYWTSAMVEFAASYQGASAGTMTAADLREIVFQIFPRKISCDVGSADECIAELTAFWKFAKREYALPQADACLAVLGGDAVARLRRELSDSANFGMAKSFFMLGAEAGYDMTNEAGVIQFMLTYNAAQLARPIAPPLPLLGGPMWTDSPGADMRRKAQKKQRKAEAKKSRRKNRR